jgi:hypothetical protein
LIRLVHTLVTAILLSRPGMPKEEATRYAVVLNEVAKEHDFDPLLAVAIIHFESRWVPAMVSDDGEDHGLGQVRARFIGACRDDEDPLHDPSEACKAVKASLLGGERNLRVMGGIISANQDLCKEKTGTAKAQQWLAGYEGYGSPDRKKWCQPGEKTWRVISYHKELLTKLHLLPAPAKAKPAKAAPASKPKAASGAKVMRVAARAKPAAKQ